MAGVKSASPRGYLPWLDILRALAIGDIVGLHVVGYGPLGGMGLQIFLLCTIALGVKRTPPHPWVHNVKRRASRLLVPYLFWCAFYGIVNTFRAIRSGKERYGDVRNPELSMLWQGTEVFLWYLLYAFFAEVLANTILHGTRRFTDRWPNFLTGAWMLLGLAMPTGLVLAYGDAAQPPIMRNWFAASLMIPSGIGIGLLLRYHRQGPATWGTLILCGLGMMLIHLVAKNQSYLNPEDNLAIWHWRIGLAILLVGLSLAVRLKAPRGLVWFASFTFPIYLLHIFVEWPVGRILDRTVGDVPDVPDVAYWLIIWAVSLSAAILIKRTPWVKRFC